MGGCGSLYVYVVVAPSSYEHAHTSTSTLEWQSSYPAASASKQTVPAVGSAPKAGCAVLSQPGSIVPHVRSPGAAEAMRVPAASAKTNQVEPSPRPSSHWLV